MLTPRRLATAATAAAAAATAVLGLTVVAPPASAATLPADSARQLVTDLRHAWQITQGRGVTVAVLSDGVDPHVTGLAGKVTVGPNYVKLGDAQELDATLIADAIAGDGSSPDNPLGTLGFAPKARILSVRVFPDPGEAGSDDFDNDASFADITARGIRYAVAHGAGVIYIDEAPFLEDSADLESAVSLALSKGVVITTMAGQDNNGPDDLTYPAAIPGVIAAALAAWPAPLMAPGSASMTTATNDSVLVTVPSNTLDEYGPGDQVYQSYNLDASPAWIAGTAALIKSAYPHLAPALVARAIALSARDHPKGGYNVHLGFGLINPYGALVQAGKLAGLSMTAGVMTAGSAQVSSAAHFGSPPGIIQAAPRSAPKLAAFTGVIAVGAIALLAGLVLAVRRRGGPVPVASARRRHAASS